MELLDTAGRPVTTIGKQGEIVGTGFINRIVPFIRYRTGDFAEYRGARCDACGREYPLLAEVAGRWPQGCLVAHDGAMITMTALNLHDDTLANVVAYQFYQDTPGRAELRIVPNGKLDAAARSSILKRMNARLQEQVTLSLALRDELPKTRSGKLLRVMQEIPGVVRDGEIV
jgi:phenylacetate-CoA ligase